MGKGVVENDADKEININITTVTDGSKLQQPLMMHGVARGEGTTNKLWQANAATSHHLDVQARDDVVLIIIQS